MVVLDGSESERPADIASSHLMCGWDFLTFTFLARAVFLSLLAMFQGEPVDACLRSKVCGFYIG